MASKAQQKDGLALFADPEQYAPRGYQLKQWLFGGRSIFTKVALFPFEDRANVNAFRRGVVTAANEARASGVDVMFLVPTPNNVDSDAIVIR
ncbi:hypothetical protein [Mesorhizobium sp.]|uniref:hypothetical protein n=1 Tax=Mesorhizobium sp. TaxID=1871066 RepID=UPI0025BB5D13|nr:hypothetical protein [Mesorhizobium sp.]